ncbi:MAG: tRNA (guanosine(46)-N7)-methyltransferase TrmB [Gloeocapsa sp. DLM2.Bin57]|nr:MAG: tRNA (guanosine(46)-N7)-methyltransferase TrmB [Gloeocapsa sp. DLM2.Bin57]
MVRVRVRQHVNPLSFKYQQPLDIPDWSNIYAELNQPLHLDLGAARGKFLQSLAQIHSNYNYLGLEIREPLVKAANLETEELGLNNVYFLFANANNYIGKILASIPELKLQVITIQFPDPWFKTRHSKRQIVQPDLVKVLLEYLQPEGIIFLQSDVHKVAEYMSQQFLNYPDFTEKFSHSWLDNNPFPVATEREKLTLAQNQPVYRILIKKQA